MVPASKATGGPDHAVTIGAAVAADPITVAAANGVVEAEATMAAETGAVEVAAATAAAAPGKRYGVSSFPAGIAALSSAGVPAAPW